MRIIVVYYMKRNASSESLLDKTQTAARLGVSLRTLDNWIAARSVPFVKLGRMVRFVPSDLEKLIESLKIGG
jgi:excisionase family DNA binding protein